MSCTSDLAIGAGTLWNIESHLNENLPKQDVSLFRPSFWSTLIEVSTALDHCVACLDLRLRKLEPAIFHFQLNIAMGQVNNALIPKEDEDTSQPWHWPLNYRVISA